MFSNGPSEHLSWKELACKDGTEYPIEWRATRAMRLSLIFELIRSECGNKPIRITSAYRTIKWNRLIGGARNSQHKLGRALDLKPPKGMTSRKFYEKIRKLADFPQVGSDIRGIGRYKSFVHVDTRSSWKLVAWTGKGMKDLLT